MNSIGLFLKVTHKCNLQCKYCYENDQHVKKKDINIDYIYKLIDKCAKYYNEISILYHGGEPLTKGYDFYANIYKYCKTNYPEKIFKFSIQSNAILLDNDYYEKLKNLDINVGISYDGLTNHIYRCDSGKTLESIKKMNNIKHIGVITVANTDYLNNIIEEYEHIKSLGITSLSINWMFGNTVKNDYTDLYIDKMKELFNYWMTDKDAIHIDKFSTILNMIFNNKQNIDVCRECHKRWIGMDVDGYLGMCDFGLLPKEENFGNINYIEDINDVLFCEKRINILKSISNRRELCIKKQCVLLGKCDGGCNSMIYKLNNSFYGLYEDHCNIWTSLYKYIGKTLKHTELDSLNSEITNNILNL